MSDKKILAKSDKEFWVFFCRLWIVTFNKTPHFDLVAQSGPESRVPLLLFLSSRKREHHFEDKPVSQTLTTFYFLMHSNIPVFDFENETQNIYFSGIMHVLSVNLSAYLSGDK